MSGPLDHYLDRSQRPDTSKKETEPSITSKTNGKHHTESISRNHSCEKYNFHEAVVSSNVSADPAPSHTAGSFSRSCRTALRLTDLWHSKWVSVQHMLDYLCLQKSGSIQSARTHCAMVAAFCRHCRIPPDELVKLSRDQVETLVQQYCDLLMKRSRRIGPSARYANTALACLKTFFACNGYHRKNGLELGVKKYHQPPRTTNRPEYVPLLKEALTMAERAGSKRNRAIILTLITTGLRNSALRAITVGDILSELEEGKQILLVRVEAEWNRRIPGACKGNIPYFTFTAKIATEAIKAMLDERKLRFGSYSPDEPLFISNYNQLQLTQRRTKNLTVKELEVIVKKAAKAADIREWNKVHVHALRKAFQSVLRSSLVDGSAMDGKDQEFLMGHILHGSQESYYDRSKVERMRELYAKLVFEDKPCIQELNLQSLRSIAKIVGVNPFEVKVAKEKELGRQLSSMEEGELLEKEIGRALERGNRDHQKPP